jgi:hypothetical protein
LFGIKDEVGPYGWRGRAIEGAVDGVVIDGIGDEEAIERAKQIFETEAQGEISPEIDKERRALAGMVCRAAAVFRQLGHPEARQQRVEVWIDGIEVPVLDRGTPWGTPTSDASARNNLGCGSHRATARGDPEMVEILRPVFISTQMTKNPHFETASSWKAARAKLTFQPREPGYTAGLRL